MEKTEIQHLRKKQSIYFNTILLIYTGAFCGIVALQWSAMAVYVILGVFCWVTAFASYWAKSLNPVLLLFPDMKVLNQYERRKLGKSWRKYHLSSVMLLSVLGVFFFAQAWFRGKSSFLEGMPAWYVIVIIVAVFLLCNLGLFTHIRRFDRLSPEALQAYANEHSLFAIIFASVFLGMTLIGTVVFLLMTSY